MARHSARLPTRRRVTASILGSATILLLAIALWQVGRADPQQVATAGPTTSTAPTTTRPETTATTAPTTTPTSRSPTTTTTTAPETTATSEPPTTTTTLAPLVLQAAGLGPVSFGATPEETISEVSARLGSADSDSGWVSSRGNFGTCPGSIVRVVRWDSLRVFFSDGPTEFGEDFHHFFYYSQSFVDTDVLIDLTTSAGIGIGSTVAELTDAYGARLEIESTSPFGVTFAVRPGGPGLLSGTLTESVPEGEVTSLAGGFGCGG